MRTACLVIALATFWAPSLYGELVFEKKLLEVRVLPDTDRLSVEFKFKVKGEHPVTITEYEAACSCLSAEISDGGKLTWQPGEKGVVKGNFKLGTFKGTIEKEIVLRILGQAHPERLKVRLHIPELFVIDPPTLFWDLNGDPKAQAFKVLVKHDRPIRIIDVAATNEQFDYELTTIKDGWEYQIEVTPKNVTTRAFGLLRIRNDCVFKKHRSAQAFMVVRTSKVKPIPK